MIIDNITLSNWMSFNGEHTIDLSISDGSKGNVILIHGETGKGKTSLMSALRWVVTGEVRMLKKRANAQAKIIRRLMMFEEPKWKGSLLNWDAYDSKIADINVTINFQHDGDKFIASRRLWAKNPDDFKSMEDEVEESFAIENKSKGTVHKGVDAQKLMNQIAPPMLLKFYVVEGDFITEYQDTLFSSDLDIEMEDSVKDAIGVHAISKMSKALNTLLSQNRELRLNRQADSDKVDDITNQIRYLTRRKKEVSDEIEELKTDIKKLDIDLNAKKTLLEGKSEVRHIIDKLGRNEERRDNTTQQVEIGKKAISKSMGELWKMLWTPVAKNLNQNREDLELSIEKSRDDRAEIRVELKMLKEIQENGKSEDEKICRVCKRPYDEDQKVEHKHEDIDSAIDDLTSKLNNLGEQIEILNREKKDRDGLEQNRKSENNIQDLIGEFNDLRHNRSMIETLGIRIQELSDKLGDGDDEEIQQWVEEKIAIEGEIDSKKERIHWLQEGDDNPESEKALASKLSQYSRSTVDDDSVKKELERIDANIVSLELLRDSSRKTETTHLERMRAELNQSMTEQFRSLISDPIDKPFYHELRTSDDWSVTCYTDNGIHQPLENPGHLLRGTLAYLGGLRQCSGIEFPVVLDNPAAPLDQDGRDALAELLVGNSKGQTILLTHSGGYALTDLLSDYAGSVARAYSLKTTGTGDRIQSHVEIVGGGLQ